MNEQSVQVTILNDSRVKDCEVGCGTDWSNPEELTLAINRIQERFGDRIKLVYIDISKNAVSRDLQEWSEKIKSNNLSLPLLLLNNQLRIAGTFDIHQLLDTIEVEIEIGV